MREDIILNIQKAEKMERREARDMLEGRRDAEEYTEGQEYEQYLYIMIDRKYTRTMCPIQMQKYFQQTFDLREEDIMSARDGYIVKVSDEEQCEVIKKARSVLGIDCEATTDSLALRIYNSNKWRIYLNEFDITVYASFEKELQYYCRSSGFLVKTKNINVTFFIITFVQKQLPSRIYIPGERARTKVYQYNPKPL